MLANGCCLDVSLGFGLLGTSLGGGDAERRNMAGQPQQIVSRVHRASFGPRRPRRRRNQHALVVAHDIDRQVVGRDIELGHLLAMGLLDAALIGLVIAGEHTAPGLEPPKQPLDLVATPIALLVQRPRLLALREWAARPAQS